MIRHAGLIAKRLEGRWRGALIEGLSGAGKSDLMLRCLGLGFQLVADDRVTIWASGGRLFGCAPDPLFGLIEVRGVGVQPIAALGLAEIVLVVSCAGEDGAMERLPLEEFTEILGFTLPLRRLRALEASTPMKLHLALECLGQRE